MGSVAPQKCGVLVLWPRIRPMSPALQGKFPIRGPLGKSLNYDGFLTGPSVSVFFFFLQPILYIAQPLMPLPACFVWMPHPSVQSLPWHSCNPRDQSLSPSTHPISELRAPTRPKQSHFPWSPAASLLTWFFSHSLVHWNTLCPHPCMLMFYQYVGWREKPPLPPHLSQFSSDQLQ